MISSMKRIQMEIILGINIKKEKNKNSIKTKNGLNPGLINLNIIKGIYLSYFKKIKKKKEYIIIHTHF